MVRMESTRSSEHVVWESISKVVFARMCTVLVRKTWLFIVDLHKLYKLIGRTETRIGNIEACPHAVGIIINCTQGLVCLSYPVHVTMTDTLIAHVHTEYWKGGILIFSPNTMVRLAPHEHEACLLLIIPRWTADSFLTPESEVRSQKHDWSIT